MSCSLTIDMIVSYLPSVSKKERSTYLLHTGCGLLV
jgi:hypothetical protein